MVGQFGIAREKVETATQFSGGEEATGGCALPKLPRPVQGELSLDKVTVLRNDLSDADVVIVRKKVQVAADPGFVFAEKPASPAGGHGGARSSKQR